MNSKIKSFRELFVWQEGHRLILDIYILTNNFPRHELFGLSSQMRRAAVSVTSNIAEGFARFGKQEKIRFYNISFASLIELQDQLVISLDLGYIQKKVFDNLFQKTETVSRLINFAIKTIRTQPPA